MNQDQNMDKNRIYNGYYLNEWDGPSLFIGACNFCELSDECDRLADELNNIEYCMCLSKGIIKDIKYKLEHPDAYFKKIEEEF